MRQKKTYFLTGFVIVLHLGIFSVNDGLYSWHFFLKKNIVINKPVLNIADIGNVYGNDINQQQKNEIENKILTDSPFFETNWDTDYIRSILEKKFEYPESIRGGSIHLIVPMKEYPPEEVAKLLKSAYPGTLGHDYKILVKKAVLLPKQLKFTVKVDPLKNPGDKQGFIVFPALNNQEKSIEIPYSLLKIYPVLTARGSIEEGDRISASNVLKSFAWVDHAIADYFIEVPIGFIANKNFKEGDVITPIDLTKKVDINYGDTVKLEYSVKNLFIESSVKACEPGAVGQIIKFRTLKNKIIYGQVVSRSKAIYASDIMVK